MLEIWTANTPNGRKAAIMLEEIGLAYSARKIEWHAAWTCPNRGRRRDWR